MMTGSRSAFASSRPLLALAGCALSLAGCHSPFVQASVENRSGGAIRLLELDYPSASFGTNNLAAGTAFHYRFKIIGSGPTKLQWTDESGHDHAATGPSLTEGQEGTLTVVIDTNGPHWNLRLTQPKS